MTELYQLEQKPQVMVCTQAEVALSLMMLWQQRQIDAMGQCVSLVPTGLMGLQEGLREGSESGVWMLQSDASEALVCELKGLLPAVPMRCVHAASELVAAATGLLAAAIVALLFVLGCLLCCCSCKIPKV